MKLNCLVFFLLMAILTSGVEARSRCDYLPNGLETAITDELNLVREDPAGYAFKLEDLEDSYHGKDRKIGPGTYLSTTEGVAAVEEAFHALQGTQPAPALSWDPCLSASAAEHVKDAGPRGLIGHDSSKGEHFPVRIRRYLTHYRMIGEDISYGSSTAAEVVQQLLVDDGVPGRGHRKNILEPRFNAVGAACGPHTRYGTMCVIDFARK